MRIRPLSGNGWIKLNKLILQRIKKHQEAPKLYWGLPYLSQSNSLPFLSPHIFKADGIFVQHILKLFIRVKTGVTADLSWVAFYTLKLGGLVCAFLLYLCTISKILTQQTPILPLEKEKENSV